MTSEMNKALLGTILAIAITTTMDATGYTAFSALPLLPLAGIFWFLQKISREEMGLTWGKPPGYGVALAYPLAVMGLIAAIAQLLGATDTSDTDWNKALLNVALMATTGVVVGVVTEEGFFRGWLWAALKRAGKSDTHVLAWTTLAFTLWHVSVISLDTGFDVPAAEIPVYLVNATLIGGVWGMLRLATGSILVPSVCHGVWNGIAYIMFGFGEKVGALGIAQTHIYGPEVGWLGIGVNLVFATLVWKWMKRAAD